MEMVQISKRPNNIKQYSNQYSSDIFLNIPQFKMQFLRDLFTKDKQQQLQASVEKSLNKLKINSNRELPNYFHELIMETSSKKHKSTCVFKVLITKIGSCKSVAALSKLFTIIFSILRRSFYAEEYLSELSKFQQLNIPSLEEEGKHKWAKQLAVCCITYMGRVASIGDIYHRALSFKQVIIGEQTMQTDLFRLLNVYSLLFPFLGQVTSTVGRYFKEDYQFYTDFYRTMRSDLFLGYTYMRYICNYFINSYTKISYSTLIFFTNVIPDLELLCDQMEDFFLNKYYRSQKLGKRLYFKEQNVQELKYFIQQEKQREGKEKGDDMVRTADSEIFSSGVRQKFTIKVMLK